MNWKDVKESGRRLIWNITISRHLSGGSGNSEKSVKGLPVSGIQNRKGVGEISKSDLERNGERGTEIDEWKNERTKGAS